ncbi:hypothetical protein K1719_029955 [Acacia pycnantha]|nr:hypothetical protein K1719_029955 [Acacia pycnantha]
MRLITLNRPRQLNAISPELGVVGLVFGNGNSSSNEDSYIERLLDRINNGKLAEDRRNVITELQLVVSESNSAQLAFGAMGFPVMLGVLKEERDDIEMSIHLKLRGSNFTQQKTINLLSALETIKLLIMGGSETDPEKDLNRQANKTALVQVLPIFPWLVDLPLEKFQMASCTTGISKGL